MNVLIGFMGNVDTDLRLSLQVSTTFSQLLSHNKSSTYIMLSTSVDIGQVSEVPSDLLKVSD